MWGITLSGSKEQVTRTLKLVQTTSGKQQLRVIENMCRRCGCLGVEWDSGALVYLRHLVGAFLLLNGQVS